VIASANGIISVNFSFYNLKGFCQGACAAQNMAGYILIMSSPLSLMLIMQGMRVGLVMCKVDLPNVLTRTELDVVFGLPELAAEFGDQLTVIELSNEDAASLEKMMLFLEKCRLRMKR
jgi:hypothetical protein